MLVPQGYRDLFLAAPHGTAIAGFASPTHTRDTETVKATLPARGTPSARLQAPELSTPRGCSVRWRA